MALSAASHFFGQIRGGSDSNHSNLRFKSRSFKASGLQMSRMTSTHMYLQGRAAARRHCQHTFINVQSKNSSNIRNQFRIPFEWPDGFRTTKVSFRASLCGVDFNSKLCEEHQSLLFFISAKIGLQELDSCKSKAVVGYFFAALI